MTEKELADKNAKVSHAIRLGQGDGPVRQDPELLARAGVLTHKSSTQSVPINDNSGEERLLQRGASLALVRVRIYSV